MHILDVFVTCQDRPHTEKKNKTSINQRTKLQRIYFSDGRNYKVTVEKGPAFHTSE